MCTEEHVLVRAGDAGASCTAGRVKGRGRCGKLARGIAATRPQTRAWHHRDPAANSRGASPRSGSSTPRYGPGGGESGSADGSSHARVHSGVAHDGPPLTHGCNSDTGPHSGRLPVSLDRNTAGWRPSAPRSSTRQPSAGAGPACTDRQLPSRVTLLSLLRHHPPQALPERTVGSGVQE